MPTADNSHQTKIRHRANKNVAVYHLLNLRSGIQGAKNPEASIYLDVVKGKNSNVSQGELIRVVDDSVNTIYNQIFGITTVPRISEWTYNSQSIFEQFEVSGPIAYGGGIWAILVANYTTSVAGMLTSSDPAGVWTLNANISSSNLLTSIYYGNGVWVLSELDMGTSYIQTSTDPTGVWTRNATNFNSINNIYYSNSTWVITTINNIRTTTNPAGNWTTNTIGGGLESLNNITYGNGIWVVTGQNGTDNVTPLYTATDPNGPWIANPQLFRNIISIAYGNGTWVVSSSDVGPLYTTTDPTGPWIANTSVTFTPGVLAFGTDTWISVAANNVIYRTSNPSGLWTLDTNSALSIDSANSYLNTIVFFDNTFVTGGANDSIMILLTLST